MGTERKGQVQNVFEQQACQSLAEGVDVWGERDRGIREHSWVFDLSTWVCDDAVELGKGFKWTKTEKQTQKDRHMQGQSDKDQESRCGDRIGRRK